MRSTGRCRRAARRQGPARQRGCPRSGRGRSGAGGQWRLPRGAGPRSALGRGEPAEPRGKAAAGQPPAALSGGRPRRATAVARDPGTRAIQPGPAEVPAPTGSGCWKTDFLGREAGLERGSVAPCPSVFLFLFIRFLHLLCFGGRGGPFLPVLVCFFFFLLGKAPLRS